MKKREWGYECSGWVRREKARVVGLRGVAGLRRVSTACAISSDGLRYIAATEGNNIFLNLCFSYAPGTTFVGNVRIICVSI